MLSLFSTIIIVFHLCFQCKYANSDDSSDCGLQFAYKHSYPGVVEGIDGRIVGGQPAYEGEFPWLVSLQVNGNHFCGGTIISEEWVLTAAHCTKEPNGKQRTNIKVKAASLTLHGGRSHSVVDIIARKEFSYKTFKGDIALLQVFPKFVFTERRGRGSVAPICLPDSDDTFEGTATVAGWGYHFSGAGRPSERLMALDVNILNRKNCQVYSIFNEEKMICAGFIEGKRDACQGDSGGPLMFNDNGVAILIGVVSYGEGCADPGKPGVYTEVSNYVNWVEGITGE